ncbi:prepilin peptidase-dependent protein C [Salmonella enterica subsp. enterica serovar Choleraesuis]|nr:prepilin peptidase-dependent protein C [Salmonella enterica subsp. enterica serovar Choleraesuis]
MKEQGFSLPEVMIAMALFAAGIVALSGFQNGLAKSAKAQQEYRMLWRLASQQADLEPPPVPSGWQANRQETFKDGCVSISATVISPGGRQGTISRLYCAAGAQSGAADVKGLSF